MKYIFKKIFTSSGDLKVGYLVSISKFFALHLELVFFV